MNRFQLYRSIRHHMKLNERRSPIFEQNNAAKIFGLIGMAVFAIYLIAGGTALGAATKGGEFSLIFIVMPFVLLVDFLMRTGIQQTPAMMIKPYLLLPLGKQRVIDSFLCTMLTGRMTDLWLCLFVPYVFICFCGGLPFWQSLALLAMLYLLIVVNSLWYLLVRTLANHHIAFWLLPVGAYALAFYKCFIDIDRGLFKTLEFCEEYGFTPLAAVVYSAVFIVLFALNRRVQAQLIDLETSQKEEKNLKYVSHLDSLSQFGKIGEYLKLEIKSAFRNKTIKNRYVQGLLTISLISILMAYTDLYDVSQEYWCLYCFLFFGATNLAKVMGPEGNFIDLLMVNKQNIYTLLQAKYYFYCAVLIIPTIILIPPVVVGKYSVMMILTYIFITSGPIYCILFQLAVYNKQTLPLNQKLTGKGNFENTIQLIVELFVFIVPSVVILTLQLFLGDTMTYTIMTVFGLLVTVAHPYWLRHIYRRMMARRYENLEGFHNSRN